MSEAAQLTENQMMIAALSLVRGVPGNEGLTQNAIADGESVAQILASWGAGDALQAAGLLHRLMCDGLLHVESVGTLGNNRVTQLCARYCTFFGEAVSADQPHSPVRPLQTVETKWPASSCAEPPSGWYGNPLAFQRIRAYCAAYMDADVAFLHAAVLWNRFEKAKRERLGSAAHIDEATQLLGPILEMLGMRQPRAHLLAWVAQRTHAGDGPEPIAPLLLDLVAAHLGKHLPHVRINTEDTQIHNFDAFNTSARFQAQPISTIEVETATEAACYEALYRLHQLFVPVEGALTDNIAVSRVNGYRGLATGVMAPASIDPAASISAIHGASQGGGQRVRINFRIVTPEMNEVNRWGLAAHQLRGRPSADYIDGWWQDAERGLALIESAPLGSLPETLYVFSPHGQLFRFRRGCTVVDFAYHVHSALADRCSRFYVNGVPVEPAFVLHHLDLVELEHDPLAPGPTQAWLDAARTSRARSQVERFLKRQGQGVYQGQRIVEQRRKALEQHYGFSIPDHRVNQAVSTSIRRLKLTRAEELFSEIAAGRWAADRLLHGLFEAEVIQQIKLPRQLGLRRQQLRLAQCCRPRPGDDIVGRPQRRRNVQTGIKIHRRDCRAIAADLQGGVEAVDLRWRLQPALKTPALIEVSALNDDGLLGDAVAQIYAMLPRVTLHKVEAVARQGIAHLRFTIEAESDEIIGRIESALRQLPDRSIDRVQRLSLAPSEQIEMAALHNVGSSNPYSRLPVHDREMFFGRARDLNRIMEWLRAGAGSIWLRGQKRLGKTSLLLHLRRYELEDQGFVPVFVDFQLLGAMEDADIFYEVANAIYSELQADTRRAGDRLDEVGAPLRELFYHDPQAQFIAYLRSVQRRLGARRLVLLLDEFSRTIDAQRRGRLDESFFYQWRGLMMATMPAISFVTVVQQKTFDLLAAEGKHEVDPIWELLELGEQMVLRSLSTDDVRRLIEWPIRNFLEYTPDTIDAVAGLTGGSPFLIQAFCFKLVAHMTRLDRHLVSPEDVEAVSLEFMQPHESLFSHLLDLIHGIAHNVAETLARLAEESGGKPVALSQLQSALPQVEAAMLRHALQELEDHDILVEPEAERWLFSSQLFQRWLALYATS